MDGKSIANECSSPRNNEPRYNFLQAMPLMLQGHLFQDMSNLNCYYHARGDKFFLQIMGSGLTEIPQVEVKQMFEFDNLRLCSTHERLAQLEEFYRKCEEPKKGTLRVLDVIEDMKKGKTFISEDLKIYGASKNSGNPVLFYEQDYFSHDSKSYDEAQLNDMANYVGQNIVERFDVDSRMNRRIRMEVNELKHEVNNLRSSVSGILEFKKRLEQFGSK